MVNRNYIDEQFSKGLAELLADGYRMVTNLMSGFQSGEITSISLEKDGQLYFYIIRNFAFYPDKTSSFFFRICGIEITLRKYNKPEFYRGYSDLFYTYWHEDSDEITSVKFYAASNTSRCNAYSDSEEKAKEMHRVGKEKRHERLERRCFDIEKAHPVLADSARAKVLPYVRRQKGFKRCTLENITSVRKLDSALYEINLSVNGAAKKMSIGFIH